MLRERQTDYLIISPTVKGFIMNAPSFKLKLLQMFTQHSGWPKEILKGEENDSQDMIGRSWVSPVAQLQSNPTCQNTGQWQWWVGCNNFNVFFEKMVKGSLIWCQNKVEDTFIINYFTFLCTASSAFGFKVCKTC